MKKKKIILEKYYSSVEVEREGFLKNRSGKPMDRSQVYTYMRDGILMSENLSKTGNTLYKTKGCWIIDYIKKYEPERLKEFIIKQ